MTTQSNKAFTLVEVAVTIVIVVLMTGTAMTILDRLVGAMIDMRLQDAAFETAREQMESLLSLSTVKDMVEFGVSEIHPAVHWQVVIEPFHEPVHNAMWVRAISSASYTDSKGVYQEIELEHWLTNLPGTVVRQILQQQKREEEYLNLLSGTAAGQEEKALQDATTLYLQQAGLNVDAYTSFLERQRRKQLEYIAREGFDGGYEDFLDLLRDEERRVLDQIGLDVDQYNRFIEERAERTRDPDSVRDRDPRPDRPDRDGTPSGDDPGFADPADTREPSQGPPWTADDLRGRGVPETLIPILLALLNAK